jgi:hypothetical protein
MQCRLWRARLGEKILVQIATEHTPKFPEGGTCNACQRRGSGYEVST